MKPYEEKYISFSISLLDVCNVYIIALNLFV